MSSEEGRETRGGVEGEREERDESSLCTSASIDYRHIQIQQAFCVFY